MENKSSALKEFQSVFQQSKDVVQNQDCASEIQEYPPYTIPWNLNEAYDILNQDTASQIQGHHGVEIEGEQSRINFPQTLDSTQIKQKRKHAEDHNQEMIVIGEQGKSLVAILQSVIGRLAELKLSRKMTDQDMGDPPTRNSDDICDYDGLCGLPQRDDVTVVKATNLNEGASNVASNEANVKISSNETCIVQGVKHNANALTDIRVASPSFQSIKEMLELGDVPSSEIWLEGLEQMSEEERDILERKLVERINEVQLKMDRQRELWAKRRRRRLE